jgi:two-component system capsular synthesis sensor histidine kinase RcsC
MPDFRPDLVLTDIGLPDVDGWKLASSLRAIAPEIVIVAISAFQTAEDEARSKAAGIVRHIGKPFSRDKILGTLGRAIT